MKLSANGFSFIKKHEGKSLKWYALNDGGLTVGYGHYVPMAKAKSMGLKVGQTITQAQADKYLHEDMEKFVKGTNDYLAKYKLNVNQNQFDALVSYAFNRGLGNSMGTNGLHQLLKNSKTVPAISKNLLVYWGTNANYKTGLMNRRKAEKVLFDTPVKSVVPPKAVTGTNTHIGVITVLVDALNVREKDSVSSPVVKDGSRAKQLSKNTKWKCYEVGKWGYRVGQNQWISKGKSYTKFTKI